MTCERHAVLQDLVDLITDALNARGRAIQPYRNELDRELLLEAAALATRYLGQPTRTFDRPNALHIVMPGAGGRWSGENQVVRDTSLRTSNEMINGVVGSHLVSG